MRHWATHCLLTLVVFCLLGVVVPMARAAVDDEALAALVDQQVDTAEMYMMRKQWDLAAYQWRAVLNHDPKRLVAHLGLARALLQSGYIDDAVRALESAQKTFKDPAVDVLLAQGYGYQNRWPEAAQLLQSVIQRYPEDLDALKAMPGVAKHLPPEQKAALTRQLTALVANAKKKARAQLAAGNFLNAAANFGVVATVSREAADINDWCMALFLAGERKQAASIFSTVKLDDKTPYYVYNNVGMLAMGMGRFPQAETLLRKAIAAAPTPTLKAQVTNNLGYLYEQRKDVYSAQQVYEQAVKLDPGLAKAKRNLAFATLQRKDYDEAVSLYKQLLAANPNMASGWNHLGFAYEMLGKKKQAINAYQKAMALDPALKSAYTNLATLYRKGGDEDKADAVLAQWTERSLASPSTAQASGTGVQEVFDIIDLYFSNQLPQGG